MRKVHYVYACIHLSQALLAIKNKVDTIETANLKITEISRMEMFFLLRKSGTQGSYEMKRPGTGTFFEKSRIFFFIIFVLALFFDEENKKSPKSKKIESVFYKFTMRVFIP